MPKVLDLRITPLDFEDFTEQYMIGYIENNVSVEGSQEHCDVYKKYLETNKEQHHYGTYEDLEYWYESHTIDARVQYADEVLSRWMSSCYTTAEVFYYHDREAMFGAINDAGFEAKNTMGHDDPSLIQYHNELGLISNILEA